MCTGKCSRCVGLSLISLSLVCIVANALLLVPDGKTWSTNQLSLQVLLMAGFIGGGLMVLCPGIAAVRAGGKGCCGTGCCGNRCRMLRSIFSSAIGVLGAIYCLGVSGAGLQTGPKCLADDKWDYHFRETEGAYLFNRTQWYLCEEPPNVVLWNLSLFSLLVVVSCLEIVLCGIQLVNATVGVICGDCRKKVGQVCIVENALLLVTDGKTWSTDQFSVQVLLMPGFIGGGLMVKILEHRLVIRGLGTTNSGGSPGGAPNGLS
ncbi:transmembrane 4 L6 family member 5 [Urocitellus parryii]